MSINQTEESVTQALGCVVVSLVSPRSAGSEDLNNLRPAGGHSSPAYWLQVAGAKPRLGHQKEDQWCRRCSSQCCWHRKRRERDPPGGLSLGQAGWIMPASVQLRLDHRCDRWLLPSDCNAGFTPDAEATPKRGVSANPWRAGAWLVTPDAEATPKRRALLIISHTAAVISLQQPRHNATLQPPVCSALRFNMGVDGSQRIGAALTPRFGVASASGVNPALERRQVQRRRNWKVLLRMR
ncbi:unnamed protein product [Pleuronectes platessa]|uniref:Uncharacterized protein n=1 Tax=Pleuronectes platessa TaxID=8262 RepID=A0A9N7VXF8_PLEPL|nr:unnamed protein product [Pleuronectes platessa]